MYLLKKSCFHSRKYCVFSFFKIISIATIVLLVIIESNAQSPWVKGKGNGYVQVSYNMISNYNKLFLKSGATFHLPRSVSDHTLQLYGEYGLGNNWQVSAVLPYKLLKTSTPNPKMPNVTLINSSGSFNSLGNMSLAVKRNIINADFLLSAQVLVELPTSSLQKKTGLRSGLDATSFVPSLSIGKGWDKYYGFVSVGTSLRTNKYSGDLRIGSELGAKPIDNVWVVLVLDVVSSFRNSTPDIPQEQHQTNLYVNNQQYFAYGIKAAYKFTKKIGINVGYFGAASGNFVAKAPSINFGMFYQW